MPKPPVELRKRLREYKKVNDLSLPTLHEKLNAHLIGCGFSKVSLRTLCALANGESVRDRTTFKCERFLEAQNA